MKYLKLFESFEDIFKKYNLITFQDIHDICKKYNIKYYTINPDGSIDVDGDVSFYRRTIYKIPLKFNKVNGNFYCSMSYLTSLEGSPIEINDGFHCSENKLTSFKGSPKIIRGGFYCQCNKINSFEYFPNHVGNEFFCGYNPIWQVWRLFMDTTKIELLNDFDIFRDEDSCTPSIIMDRLNDFLTMIGKPEVKSINGYKNI